MVKWLIRRRLAAFERTYGYDASYMREVLAADAGAFLCRAQSRQASAPDLSAVSASPMHCVNA